MIEQLVTWEGVYKFEGRTNGPNTLDKNSPKWLRKILEDSYFPLSAVMLETQPDCECRFTVSVEVRREKIEGNGE